MSDDIIKNPARNRENIQKEYEPEYKKMNREPIVNNVGTFDFKNTNGKPPLQILEEVPEQTHVFVGRNQNWFDESSKNLDFKTTVAQLEKNVDSSIEEIKIDEPKANTPSITDVAEGSLCLLVKGEILAIADSKDSISSFIEKILLEQDSKYKDITINDLHLFKRLPVKVGVLVIE